MAKARDSEFHYQGTSTDRKTARTAARKMGIVAVYCLGILLISKTTLFAGHIDSRQTAASFQKQDAEASFDHVVKEAFALHAISIDDVPRRNFNVSDWSKASDGGLGPKDRQLVGDVYRNATSLFEYGLGESTYIADHVGMSHYAGIDSAAEWVSGVRSKVASHFRFYLADIGPTEMWGYPRNESLAKNVFQYQVAPLLSEQEPFDVYMVDGRWRLPCMLLSFLHASARGADPTKTIVLLHDCVQQGFTPRHLADRMRVVYRAADHLLDLVGHSGELLCVYKRKANTTDQDLYNVWLRYRSTVL